jgi:hypothetical protein
MLRPLGVALDGTNINVRRLYVSSLNTTVPSSVLKKKHNGIANHCIRVVIAARIIIYHE